MPATAVSTFDPRTVLGPHAWPSGDPALELVIGDLTREATDAIVNPVGPGLVDLAIRRAAGPELLEAFHHCVDELPAAKLARGEAIATPGFRLPAGHVIHCSPPVYLDDHARARRDLVACHVEALGLARARGWTSVAFPAIGTGVYGYPAREAAPAAIGAVVAELRRHGAPGRVRFVLASPETLRLYVAAAAAAFACVPASIDGGFVFADLHTRGFAAA